jgi:gamma-glutamyltranspeptidase / glutathione hydrolase
MPGVVAAGAHETARAAVDILGKGGNAVDAAIAACAAAFLAEPVLAGAGGSGLMTVALPGHEPAAIDFFSDMPGLGGAPDGLDFFSIEIDFGPVTQEFHIGRGAAAVPGALPGLAEAHRRFGSLPLHDLMAPAIGLAMDGVEVSASAYRVSTLLEPILSRCPEIAKIIAGGPEPRLGARVRNPDLAGVLREFAALGRTPDRVIENMLAWFGPQRGGLITEADVRAYQPRVSAPLVQTRGDWSVHCPPLPGGHLATIIFHALAAGQPQTSEAAELLRYARASRTGHGHRQSLTMPGNTTHISVVDVRGGAAAVTLTNGEGCGQLIPGTGIQLNNFLGEEDINPGGFHRHRPGARMPTMMAPTVGLRAGIPALAMGSGGSNRIRTAVGQTLYRAVVLDQPLEQAVSAPRVHAEDDTVWVELESLKDGDAALAALAAEFRFVHAFARRDFFFGGVHSVALDREGRLHGVGDARRGGVALFSR